MSENDKRGLAGWLGFREPFDYSKARWLGPIISGVMIAVVAGLFILAIASAIVMLSDAVFGDASLTPGNSLGVGAVTVALIGAPFVIWRSVVAQKSVDVQEQGQITDRINKAVEGLGATKLTKTIFETPRYKKKDREWLRDESGDPVPAKRPDGEAIVDREIVETSEPNLEVRIGAIYALERISQDSARDHIQIMEILCAYVRQNAKVTDLTPREPPFENPRISIDIQAVIDVIGRRSERQKALEMGQKHRLDLRETDLSFANFAKGDFAAAILANCKLEGCNFRDAILSGAIMHSSVLNFAEFFRCNLTGAKLDSVVINRPIPAAGSFTASINMGETKGVSFPSADLTALQHLGSKEKMNEMMGSGDTSLSGSLRHKMPPVEVMEKNIYRGMQELEEQEAEDLLKIEHAGFKCWFPFDAKRDMAFGPERRKFLVELGLDHWPYIED